MFEDHIHFSFLIKKNCKKPQSEGASAGNKFVKPKPLGHAMTNKSSMKGNNSKKCQSIPDGKTSSGAEDLKGTKNQPPDYSSINRVINVKRLISPAHCHESMKRNDDEIVSQTNSLPENFLKSFHCRSN